MTGMVGSIFSAVGNAVNNMYGRWANERDFGYQKDLNNNQISWRVADAQRAGIHPLAALGINPAGSSPISTNFSQDAGQDLTRASLANADRAQRERELSQLAINNQMEQERANKIANAQVDNLNAETEAIRSQIARANGSQLGPGSPLPQTERSGVGVRTVPSRVVTGSSDSPARQPGAITDTQFYHRNDGSIGIVASEQMKERMEDMPSEEVGWALRNQILPFFSGLRPPSTEEYPLPRGYIWRWNPALQGFYPYNVDAYHERRSRRENRPGRRTGFGIVN